MFPQGVNLGAASHNQLLSIFAAAIVNVIVYNNYYRMLSAFISKDNTKPTVYVKQI